MRSREIASSFECVTSMPRTTPIATRIDAIARHGLPNFFGPQRFGREGANLRKISPDLSSVHPRDRSYVLSAARSLVFNAVLAERVRDGSWCQLEVG